MSAALKQAVPAPRDSIDLHLHQYFQHNNLISYDRLPIDTAKDERLKSVSQGWKHDSFQSASTKLASSASRIGAEASKESKYWEQMARIKSRGWLVSRLPSNSKAIGVHFGFPEAAPQFRTRGFALLRQNAQGDLELDRGNATTKRSIIHVSILRQGQETGSTVPSSSSHVSITTIEDQISQARDALFEEELFYELGREARSAANFGITTQPGIIEADIEDGYKVRLSLQDFAQPEAGDATRSDTELARYVSLVLRMLLSNAHQRSLARRSQPPDVMGLTPRNVPEYPLFRPVIAQLRHRAACASLLRYCTQELQPLQRAGILVNAAYSETSERPAADMSPVSRFSLDQVQKPEKSKLLLRLISGQVSIGITTLLGAPTWGTRYQVFVGGQEGGRPSPRLTLLPEVKDAIIHAIGSVSRLTSSMRQNNERIGTVRP